jgi:hypothetical protein
MTKHLPSTVAAILGTVLASQVFAEGLVSAGAGESRCSTLNSQAKGGTASALTQNSTTAMIFGWAQGFLSGLNAGHGSTFKDGLFVDLSSISPDEQWAFITAYCRENPSKKIVDAVLELASKRLRSTR